jgi:hypothetical protein
MNIYQNAQPQILKWYVLVGTLSPQYIFNFLKVSTFPNTTCESPTLSIRFGYIARLPIFNLRFVKHMSSGSKENGTLANKLTQIPAPISSTKNSRKEFTLSEASSTCTTQRLLTQTKQTNTAPTTLLRHCRTEFQLPSTYKYIPYPYPFYFFSLSHMVE